MGTQRGRLSQKNIFWEKFHKHTPHRSKFYSQKSDKIKTSQRKIYIQGGAYKKNASADKTSRSQRQLMSKARLKLYILSPYI